MTTTGKPITSADVKLIAVSAVGKLPAGYRVVPRDGSRKSLGFIAAKQVATAKIGVNWFEAKVGFASLGLFDRRKDAVNAILSKWDKS